MKTHKFGIKVLIMAFITFGFVTQGAASRVVEAQDDLQKAVDEAANDDTLVLQPGTYNANITFTKPLKIFANTGAPVNLGGVVEIRGNGSTYFQQINFLNNVNVQAGGSISLVQCAFNSAVDWAGAAFLGSSNNFKAHAKIDLSNNFQPNMEAYDSSFYSLDIIGGKALLKRCYLAGYYKPSVPLSQLSDANQTYALGLTGTAFEGIRLTNAFGLFTKGTGVTPFTLVQSQIGYNNGGYYGNLSLSSNKVWLGYNRILGSTYARDCDTVAIGNQVFVQNNIGVGFQITLGSVMAYNNVIISGNTVAIYLSNLRGFAEFVNNTVFASTEYGIRADGNFQITSKANIFYGSGSAYSAPNSGVRWDISYCLFGGDPTAVGVPNPGGFNSFNGADPGFDNLAYSANFSLFKLRTNSICRAGGPPEPIYNNLDGTRNDIGYTGGPLFNPANYTNTNPMVYLLTATNRTFTAGRTNIISIDAAAISGN